MRFGDRDLDVFEHELQLIGIELLRALAEPRAFIFFDEQLEAFDRFLGCGQLTLDMKARCALMLGADPFGLEHGALSFKQRPHISGKPRETG